MPEDEWNISNAKQLSINHANLSQIPFDCSNYSQLESLDLSYNKITFISENIGQLKQLKHLNLSNNSLETVGEWLTELTNLQTLNLSNNHLNHIPESIQALKQLKVLRLKGNNLKSISDAIAQLSQLVKLDLSFNPIEELPESIAELKQLRHLNCISNQFKVFPYVLLQLSELENLDDLDLYFRLKIESSKLRQFYKIIKILNRSKASFELKKAAFDIYFYQRYDGPLEPIYPLLSIHYRSFADLLRQFLEVHQRGALHQQAQIAILGETTWIEPSKLENVEQVSTAIKKETTHIVAGRKIRKSSLQNVHAQHFFVSEKALLKFLFPDQDAPWLLAQKSKLIDLLQSDNNANIALAVELTADNSIQDELLTELLWAYTRIESGNKMLRNTIQEIFIKRIPGFQRHFLPGPNFRFYTEHKSELQIRKGIHKICSKCQAWDALKIAQLIFQKYGAAFEYILLETSTTVQKQWLSQFVQDKNICLSSLHKLNFLPQAVVLFDDLERIDLKFCNFRNLPDVELLKQLPQLEQIDLRNNPLSSVPRKQFKELSNYRIYLST